jgi:hypothetical protein
MQFGWRCKPQIETGRKQTASCLYLCTSCIIFKVNTPCSCGPHEEGAQEERRKAEVRARNAACGTIQPRASYFHTASHTLTRPFMLPWLGTYQGPYRGRSTYRHSPHWEAASFIEFYAQSVHNIPLSHISADNCQWRCWQPVLRTYGCVTYHISKIWGFLESSRPSSTSSSRSRAMP